MTDPEESKKNKSGYGLTGISHLKNKNLSPPKERATSAVSKYSAVVFTKPAELTKPSVGKNTTSEEEDYEDDFEDEFEPYETSNEEEKEEKSKNSRY